MFDFALAHLVVNFMSDAAAGVGEMRASGSRWRAAWARAGAYVASLDRSPAALKDDLRARLAVGDDPFSLSARAWISTGRV